MQSAYHVVVLGDEYSVDHMVGITVSLFQIKLQALPEEYAHRTGVVGVRNLLLRLGSMITGASVVHDFRQAKRQLVFGDRLYDAVRLTPQRKWILRPARDESQRKHAGDTIGLVGD